MRDKIVGSRDSQASGSHRTAPTRQEVLSVKPSGLSSDLISFWRHGVAGHFWTLFMLILERCVMKLHSALKKQTTRVRIGGAAWEFAAVSLRGALYSDRYCTMFTLMISLLDFVMTDFGTFKRRDKKPVRKKEKRIYRVSAWFCL